MSLKLFFLTDSQTKKITRGISGSKLELATLIRAPCRKLKSFYRKLADSRAGVAPSTYTKQIHTISFSLAMAGRSFVKSFKREYRDAQVHAAN
jgi:hypothetical protein